MKSDTEFLAELFLAYDEEIALMGRLSNRSKEMVEIHRPHTTDKILRMIRDRKRERNEKPS